MKCTDGGNVAWKLETRNRQLQIGIRKFYDGIENRIDNGPTPKSLKNRFKRRATG